MSIIKFDRVYIQFVYLDLYIYFNSEMFNSINFYEISFHYKINLIEVLSTTG